MEEFLEYLIMYFTMPALGPFIFEITYNLALGIIFNRDKSYKSFLTWVIIIAETILMWLLLFIMRFIKQIYCPDFGIIVIIFLALMTIVYGIIKGRKNIKISLFYAFFLAAYGVYLTSFVQAIPDFFCAMMKMETPTIAFGISSAIASPIMTCLMVVLIFKFPLDRYGNLSWRHISIPSIFLFLSCLMQIYNMQITQYLIEDTGQGTIEQSKRVFIFYIGIVLYTLIVIGYLYCYNHTKNESRNKNLSMSLMAAEKYAKESENMNSIIQANLDEMRSLRHEINNQLSYMQIMMSQKNYSKLEEYFEEFNKNMPSSLEFCDTNNITIRNVIGLEQYKAKQNKIKIISNIRVSQKLNILDFDLTALLLNLLDNSIEAIQMDQIENAQVEISILEKDNFLFINVINPIKNDENNSMRLSLNTLKGDKTIHGHGTKIIKKIADKYNGLFEWKIDNNKFVVDVMLSLIGKEYDRD